MSDIGAVLEYYGADVSLLSAWGIEAIHCPFHHDNHKSASVDLGEGWYRCHGCDMRGDAIRLIESWEGVGFVEAQRRAAEISGGGDGALRVGDGAGNPGMGLPDKGARSSRRTRSRLPPRGRRRAYGDEWP